MFLDIYNQNSYRHWLQCILLLQDTIEQYYAGKETRRRTNEKLNRFFTARNDEWIRFLATVFPDDIIAQSRITVLKLATKMKNIRNSNYRGREKYKIKPLPFQPHSKVHLSNILNYTHFPNDTICPVGFTFRHKSYTRIWWCSRMQRGIYDACIIII